MEDFESNKEKIRTNIEELKKIKNIHEEHPFHYALENFKKKLFEDQKNKKSLFDMIIEFKPGIFISARIRGNNLILKNITYVKTEHLERLNEALTGNKKITLNEDTQNSFTPENNKEISFTSDFRVIGTCNEGEETSLSEAFMSRFTLIYVNKYKKEEEIKVLNYYAKNREDIEVLNKLLDKYYSSFPDSPRMNLSQKINCFKITKEINSIRNKYSKYDNLKLVTYYLLKGLNEKREDKINEINNIFEIKNYYDDKIKNSPIELINNTKELFIRSKLNDLKLNMIPIVEKSENNVKISLEAIEYYAKMAKLELILVPISKSTKVDDLLCKTIFKKNKKGNFCLENQYTPLCHAIECKDNFPNKLVVLEGINNATPAVLEVLNSIYGEKGTNILLPNGAKIVKGNMNLISILNPSDYFTREKLPGNLINNSLYFIVEDPNKNDIGNIISELFEEAHISKKEKDEFFSSFLKAQNIAKNGTGELPITLNEVGKYISFIKSIPNFDKNIFMTFIFYFHFSQIENMIKVKKELNLDTFLFNPIIYYEGDKKKFILQTSKKSNKDRLEIKVKNPNKINVEKLKKNLIQ